jgi:hypothetical protein
MYNGYPTRLIMPTSHILNTTSVDWFEHMLQFGAEFYHNRGITSRTGLPMAI